MIIDHDTSLDFFVRKFPWRLDVINIDVSLQNDNNDFVIVIGNIPTFLLFDFKNLYVITCK